MNVDVEESDMVLAKANRQVCGHGNCVFENAFDGGTMLLDVGSAFLAKSSKVGVEEFTCFVVGKVLNR